MGEDGLHQSDDTGDCHLEAVCFFGHHPGRKKTISLSAKYPTERIFEEVLFHQLTNSIDLWLAHNTKFGAIHIDNGPDFLQWDLNRGGK